ncbi:hypothetical protein Vretimale_15570, partial [Volvox reticuliferus]
PPPPPSPSPPSPSPPEPWRSIPSFGPGTLQPALGKSDLRWGRRWKPPSPPPPPPLQPLAPPAGPPGNDLQRSGDSDESLAAAAPMFPATWDARNKTLTGGRRIISSVKNQYSCNACVSFAVIAAAETAFAKGRGVNAAWVDFSEHRLFFCDSQQAVRPASCSLGWSVSDALAALQRSGVYLECCWNYLPGKGASFCNRPSSCSTQRPGSDCKPVPGRWVVQKVNWGSAEAANTSAAKDMVMNSGSAIACFREYADMTRCVDGRAWVTWIARFGVFLMYLISPCSSLIVALRLSPYLLLRLPLPNATITVTHHSASKPVALIEGSLPGLTFLPLPRNVCHRPGCVRG